jgi:hypothetical protein
MGKSKRNADKSSESKRGKRKGKKQRSGALSLPAGNVNILDPQGGTVFTNKDPIEMVQVRETSFEIPSFKAIHDSPTSSPTKISSGEDLLWPRENESAYWFTLRIPATAPPPGHGDHLLSAVTEEMLMRFGQGVTVRPKKSNKMLP